VHGALDDLEGSALPEADKALLRFVARLNDEPARVGEADVAALHAVGWSDEAVYDAVSVCALFNFYNRWIDGTGVHALSDEAHRAGAKHLAHGGYVRSGDE
jgi:alkylhydroperoxidase family enzyme